MPLMKFQTVGRDRHRYGRISVVFDADVAQKKLFVNMLEARDLNGGYTGDTVHPQYTHFRLQLLPSQNPVLVTQVSRFAPLCALPPTWHRPSIGHGSP